MALSFPPQLTGDAKRDIIALHSYLYDIVEQFNIAALQEAAVGQVLLGAELAGNIGQIGLQPGLAITAGILGHVADSGWSVTGTATDKALASGDSLTATQDVLATLIQTLIVKGLLSA